MYQKTVLPNGIRVITEYIPYVRSLSLGVWFEVGSRDELDHERGLSHFIEHMMFKGSERYTAREIAEVIDQSGGQINAFTAKEYTCYYTRVLDEYFPLAADVLQQMLLHSLFKESEIDKERNVVLEELSMAEDTPDELVHDLLSETLWPSHSLGLPIIGTKESILSFDRHKIVSFLKRCYTTERLVITCAGNIPHERIVDEFASGFASLQRGDGGVTTPPQVAVGNALIKPKDTEQVHMCIGGPALSRNDERKSILNLLDTITGGGMSSLLFQELREERGLVYNTYSYHSSYRDIGDFRIYAGFSERNLKEVVKVIKNQLDHFPALIDEQIVSRAKGQLKGNMMLSLESMTSRMHHLARNELNYGRIITTDEIIQSIEQVSTKDIAELAGELYKPEKWSIAAIGPFENGTREDLLCLKTC